ncbi:MAG: hypothetical protein J6K03_08645 [Oscillospiraceae bacterium]|nr:hypothetical protein [Oscillospiraceae bacterium]
MSLLSDLTAIAANAGIAVETGVFQAAPPEEYLVLTPLSDTFDIFADNDPGVDVQELRVSLFTTGNYTKRKNALIRDFLAADLTITDRRYLGYDTETGYHNYAMDVANYYEMEE